MSCNCKQCECEEKENDEEDEKKEKIQSIVKIVIGLIFLILGIVLAKIDKTYTEFSFNLFTDSNFFTSYLFYSFLSYTIGYLYLAYFLIKESIDEFKEGNYINEFTLMLIATVGAYCIGEFFEAILVLILSNIGEMFEDYATSKSKASIKSLVNNMPLYAHKLENDKIVDVKPEDVKINDILEIRPGEKLALDGVIVKGQTSLDLSSINGESIPSDVKQGDKVYSGSINLNSVIQIKVSKEYKDSTLSKILNLVENEQAKKAKTEKFITRFAKYYTPIVVLIALMVFLIGFGLSKWDFNNGGRDYLYKALSILLISCPCSLVISVPIAFFSGIGVASKYGILIKGSQAVENLSKAKYFIFDKTGTLTKGNFVLENNPSEKYLQIAASLEAKSTHPLAKALLNANKKDLLEVEEFTNIPGLGIKGKILDKVYVIGNLDLLKQSKVKNIKQLDTPYKVLYLAEENGSQIEQFVVADQLKEQTIPAINALKNEKIQKSIMLSGDDNKIAQLVSDKVGLDEYIGELLPEEKLAKVKEYSSTNKTCYVGDGINDSPSLLAANVGIAMGGLGSDAAIEASDIVILDDDLRKIAEGKRIANRTMLTAYTGIIFSIIIKLLMMILVSLGYFGNIAMIIGTISDTGVMALCVLNACSVMLYKTKYIKK